MYSRRIVAVGSASDEERFIRKKSVANRIPVIKKKRTTNAVTVWYHIFFFLCEDFLASAFGLRGG